MKIDRPQYALAAMLFASVVLPIGAVIFSRFLLGDWHWVNEPAHSLVEIFGSLVGLFLSVFFLSGYTFKKASHYQWAAYGLLGMAIVHGFHAFSPPGNLFVWFYTTAILIGGFLFSLVWLPIPARQSSRAWPIHVLVPLAATLFCLLSIPAAHHLPTMLTGTSFSASAKVIATLGGILFLVSAIYFIRRFHSKRNIEDFLFSAFCMLNGAGGFLFLFSEPWSGIWWFWHFMRLAAYIIVLSFIFIIVQQEDEVVRRNEELYGSILHTSLDGFWIVDRQGCILEVNEAYCQLTGYDRGELLSRHIQDIDAIQGREEVAKNIHRIIQSGRGRFETRHRCKDGSLVDIEVSTTYLDIAGGRFITFLRDITERHHREEENQRQNRIQAIIHSLLTLSLTDCLLEDILHGALDLIFSASWIVLECRIFGGNIRSEW